MKRPPWYVYLIIILGITIVVISISSSIATYIAEDYPIVGVIADYPIVGVIVGCIVIIVAIIAWFSKEIEKPLKGLKGVKGMKGWWCKKCKDFVEMKKDYTTLKIVGTIHLIVILIGLIVGLILGGLIVGLITGLIVLIVGSCLTLYVGYIPSSEPVCSICGKGVRKKKMPPEYNLKSQKLREEGI